MTTIDDLARVERELRFFFAEGNSEILRTWADTIAAYIAAQREREANMLALAEAVNQRIAVGGWQPIETAPRDTLVLVHCNYASEPALARLTDAGWKLGVEHHETNCGTYCLGGSPGGYATFATHWMPLPPPPTATSAEKEKDDG